MYERRVARDAVELIPARFLHAKTGSCHAVACRLQDDEREVEERNALCESDDLGGCAVVGGQWIAKISRSLARHCHIFAAYGAAHDARQPFFHGRFEAI